MTDGSTDPELLFGEIADYIDQAEACLASEDIESLAALSASVDVLNARVGLLPRDVMVEYAPEVEYLLTRMQALCDGMVKKQMLLTQDAKAADKRVRAMHAYHKAPHEGA